MSGVTAIDRQHEKLIDMYVRLNEAVKNNVPREDIYWIIEDVIIFTRIHFDAEEKLMIQSGYPELEAHLSKHKELIKEVHHLKLKLDYVGEKMFMDWLNHWPRARVLAHIQYADKQVEDHIIQRERLHMNLQRKADFL